MAALKVVHTNASAAMLGTRLGLQAAPMRGLIRAQHEGLAVRIVVAHAVGEEHPKHGKLLDTIPARPELSNAELGGSFVGQVARQAHASIVEARALWLANRGVLELTDLLASPLRVVPAFGTVELHYTDAEVAAAITRCVNSQDLVVTV